MNFKAGDKVTFLNQNLSGVIVSVINNGQVKLITDDGFELVVEVKDIIHSVNTNSALSNSDLIINYDFRYGLFFAFVPKDNFNHDSDIEIYLINTTGCNVYYSFCFKHEGNFICKSSDELLPQSSILLDCFTRKMLPEYSTIKLDAIFFKKMPHQHISPVSEIIKPTLTKFYKPGFFTSFKLLSKPAHIIELYANDGNQNNLESDEFKQMVNDLVKSKMSKKQIIQAKSHKHYQMLREMEVDLHLEEIIDDSKGMTNAEKLLYQLNYFQTKLDEAIANNYIKVTFIHGVGNGKLKSEITKILSTYDNITYYDAPYAKHGFGATEVKIKHQ